MDIIWLRDLNMDPFLFTNNGNKIAILIGKTNQVNDLLLINSDLLASSSSDYTVQYTFGI